MRRAGMLVVLAALALPGCGGSGSPATTTARRSTTTSTTSPVTTSAPTAVSTTSTAASTTGAAASTTSVSTTSVSTTTAPTTAGSSTSTTATNANVRLAATFIIRAGGRLFPSEVAAPTHTTIMLTVRAGDSRRHQVTVATPHPHTEEVAPGRPARLELEGVADGTYAVKVNGERRGALIVGAQPGP